jgi:hypothetical protein
LIGKKRSRDVVMELGGSEEKKDEEEVAHKKQKKAGLANQPYRDQ